MKKIPAGLACLLLAGCAADTVNPGYDNPAIRKLQNEETDRHISDGVSRVDLKRYIGARVSILFIDGSNGKTDSSGAASDAGRATALTSDGYFITACHVVQGHTFFIEETAMIRTPPSGSFKKSDIGRFLSTKRYPGRLVWCDPAVDLAILKFPVANWPHFQALKVPPLRGDVVFSADDQGRSAVPIGKRGVASFGSAVGNGAFFAAGEVRTTPTRNRETKSIEVSTSLVARGGMSGAPLVTGSHELCGIISRVESFGFSRSRKTIALMIEPEVLSGIIEADRNSRAKSGPR